MICCNSRQTCSWLWWLFIFGGRASFV